MKSPVRSGVEREPQHGYAVLGPSRPRHPLVRTSCPLLGRHHRATLHLPYDRNDPRIVAITAGGPRATVTTPCTTVARTSRRSASRHGRTLADGAYRGVSELITPIFRGRKILRSRG